MPIMAPAKPHPSVRYILPSGTPSPTLKMAQSGALAWGTSKVLGVFRDDQALATMRRPSARGRGTGTSLFPSALFDSLTPHYLRRRFTHHSLTLSFSPIEPNNSPVSTRQSNGTIPYPPRLLARLICADLQALRDKLGRVKAWSRVGV